MAWFEIRSALARHLVRALDSESTAELPPLAEGANGAIFATACFGGEATGLQDLRYAVRTVDPSDDGSLRRKKKCGTYRSKSNDSKEITNTMSDTRMEIWDVRAKKRVARKAFRAETPKCPKQIKKTSSGKHAYVKSEGPRQWAKDELARRVGSPIESK